MGSFSWTKAVKQGNHANIVQYDRFKFLIPEKFGGGYIIDAYQDYGILSGKIVDDEGNVLKDYATYDMYELLAFWNAENDKTLKKRLKYDGIYPKMKTRDENTVKNRELGIKIGCYDEQIDKLEYPLKLVSVFCKGTYEDCKGRSYGDPNQGFYELSWREFKGEVGREI